MSFRGRQNMAPSSVNPSPRPSFTSPLARCGLQGMNANLAVHRLMNSVKIEQLWRRDSPLASHKCLTPSEMTPLRRFRRSSADADYSRVWLHSSVNGTLLHKGSRNTSTTCHAQIHNDAAIPVELPSLSHTGNTLNCSLCYSPFRK